MVEQAEEYVPKPSLTTGSQSDPEDYNPRPTKVPRFAAPCSCGRVGGNKKKADMQDVLDLVL